MEKTESKIMSLLMLAWAEADEAWLALSRISEEQQKELGIGPMVALARQATVCAKEVIFTTLENMKNLK